MQINTIKRPWQRTNRHDKRYKSDPFYHSKEWKQTRKEFRLSSTIVNGRPVSNELCVECYKSGTINPGKHTDHITRIKDAGNKHDHSNLQTLCDHHHAIKSANEGNENR